MWLLIIFPIALLIPNSCLATVHNSPKNDIFYQAQTQLCRTIGDTCREQDECCSDLICDSIQESKRCLPPSIDLRSKHSVEDFIIPPYYNPNNQLYPYGISKPALPFYKGKDQKQYSDTKKMEWEICQFHEDCGEGNCCYVHFRFRSLPKWFCRPNRNDESDLCTPLTKYRSLKDAPAWKQQQQQKRQ